MLADRVHPLVPHHLLLNRGSHVRHVGSRARLRIRLIQVDRLRRPLLLGIARMIHAQVGRNAVKPGAELCFRPIRLPRPVHPQENLLRQFFRNRLVPHHAEHEVNDGLTVLLNEKVIAAVVPVPDPEHELGVAQFPGNPRHLCRYRTRRELLSGFERHGRHIFTNPNFAGWLRWVRPILASNVGFLMDTLNSRQIIGGRLSNRRIWVPWARNSAYFVKGFYRERPAAIPDWQPPAPNDRLTLEAKPSSGA